LATYREKDTVLKEKKLLNTQEKNSILLIWPICYDRKIVTTNKMKSFYVTIIDGKLE